MKKKASRQDKITLTLRLKSQEEHELFKQAAEIEGFTTLTAWMLFYLRQRANTVSTMNAHGSTPEQYREYLAELEKGRRKTGG